MIKYLIELIEIHWLADWFIDRLVDKFIDRLTYLLFDGLMIDELMDWWIDGLMNRWIYLWFIDWLIRLPAQWSTTLILQFRSNKTSSWQTRTRNGRLPQIHSDHNKVGSDILRSLELGKIQKLFCYIISFFM